MDQHRAGPLHLGEGALAVAGRDLHGPDAVDQDVSLIAQRERVEDGRPHAVVGGEAPDDDPPDPVAPQEAVELERGDGERALAEMEQAGAILVGGSPVPAATAERNA